MKNINIILISGHAGVGKDTVANYICKKYNYRSIAYADPIKTFCSENMKIPLKYFYDQELKTKDLTSFGWPNFTPRKLIQFIGTNLFRENLDENFWVKCLVKRIESYILTTNFIITDARYQNELYPERFFMDTEINVNSKKIIQIKRKGYNGNPIGGIQSHSSENEIQLPSNTIIINNDGSLENLYQTVDDILK
jgi:dephospho-CoA kinase